MGGEFLVWFSGRGEKRGFKKREYVQKGTSTVKSERQALAQRREVANLVSLAQRKKHAMKWTEESSGGSRIESKKNNGGEK